MDRNIKKRLEKRRSCEEFSKREITRNFRRIMDQHGLVAQMKMKLQEKKLQILVGPSNTKDKENLSNLYKLSGGEKSKTVALFIHTLWEHISCPFRALDEWDQYLDEKNRPETEKLQVETSKNSGFQFFFISPQNSVYENHNFPENGPVKFFK